MQGVSKVMVPRCPEADTLTRIDECPPSAASFGRAPSLFVKMKWCCRERVLSGIMCFALMTGTAAVAI